MKGMLLTAVLVSLLAGAATVEGHHPTGRLYRVDEQTTIEGVVVSLIVKSPHSFIHVEAPDRLNKTRVWAVECGDGRTFRRRVDERALKPGDRVVITGDAAIDEGLWRVRLRTLVRPADGWQWRENPR